jgi:hypothetical protein
MGMLAPTDLRQWPSGRKYMPPLLSLADRSARVRINMALLKELFASTRGGHFPSIFRVISVFYILPSAFLVVRGAA